MRSHTISVILALFPIFLFTLWPSFVHAGTFSLADSCPAIGTADLSTDMQNEIDARVNGISYSTTTASIFSTVGYGTTSPWVRNTGIWTSRGTSSLDLSGVSSWNSATGNQYLYPGTLISPRNVLEAAHIALPIGTVLAFVDNNDNVVTRTVIAGYNVPGTDAEIQELDSDVPNTVAYYPIIDVPSLENYAKTVSGLPLVMFSHRFGTITINDISSIPTATATTSEMEFQTVTSSSSPEYSFSYPVWGGDSGQPDFLVIGGRLVLVTTNHLADQSTLGTGPFFPDLIPSLDAWMLTHGGYQVSTLDLSCFKGQDQLAGPSSYTFSLNSTSTLGTVVGPLSFTGLQPLSYSVAGGLFTVNASGTLSVVATNLGSYFKSYFTYSNPLSSAVYDATATAQYTGWYAPIPVSAGITFNVLNVAPTFSLPQYSFFIQASASAGTIAGILSAKDWDATGSLSYSIQSGGAGLFNINTSSGNISVANGATFNANATSSYALTVAATDGAGNVATTSVTIGLTADAPAVSFASSSAVIGRYAGTYALPVILSQPYARDLTMTFVSENGSALLGSDFALGSTTVTIPAGQTEGYLPVAITTQSANPNGESFFLVISSTDGATLGNTDSEFVTIVNNLTTPVISSISSAPTSSSAAISWMTSTSTTGSIAYGTSVNYGSSFVTIAATTSQSLTLTGLSSCQGYHYQISSLDAYGDISTSSDQTFTTSGCAAPSGGGGGGGSVSGGGGGGSTISSSLSALSTSSAATTLPEQTPLATTSISALLSRITPTSTISQKKIILRQALAILLQELLTLLQQEFISRSHMI